MQVPSALVSSPSVHPLPAQTPFESNAINALGTILYPISFFVRLPKNVEDGQLSCGPGKLIDGRLPPPPGSRGFLNQVVHLPLDLLIPFRGDLFSPGSLISLSKRTLIMVLPILEGTIRIAQFTCKEEIPVRRMCYNLCLPWCVRFSRKSS